jgi:hypothetical protein
MTIAIWANLPANTTNNTQNIMEVYLPSINAIFNIHASGPTGVPQNQYVMGSQCGNYSGFSIDGTAASAAVSSGWTHLAGQFVPVGGTPSSVQNVIVFFNGTQVGNVSVGGPVPSFSIDDTNSQINARPGHVAGNIAVAYPAVWKRILSSGEIASLAAQGDPRVVASANLASFVDLNRTSGSFPDLVSPSITWTVSGSMSLVANPFNLTPAGGQNPVIFTTSFGVSRAA